MHKFAYGPGLQAYKYLSEANGGQSKLPSDLERSCLRQNRILFVSLKKYPKLNGEDREID